MMNLSMDTKVADGYKSLSQKARVITENWVHKESYCPQCISKLEQLKNNMPVNDFRCENCTMVFELKSKKGTFGSRVSAGAYKSIMKKILTSQVPHFMFLSYLDGYTVKDFFIVPGYFFTPDIIQKRNPLGKLAERAGWIGSNIILGDIPESGRISYINNGIEIDQVEVSKSWKKTLFLKDVSDVRTRGWIVDIMKCIDIIGKKDFNLSELYAFEGELQEKHPDNMHVREKIRQQLQVLRDMGYIEFLGEGSYIKNI